ncbi:MAG TPA: hypothetical protein VGK59_18635 [Ohtaekwangia sp.]
MNTNENNSGTLKFSKPTPNFPKGGEEIKDGEFVSSVKEKTKHTPGPWSFNEPSGSIDSLDSNGHTEKILFDVRKSNWRSISEDEHKANARLIASAPDLLKENQGLKESIEFWKKAYNGEEAQSAQLREGLVNSIKENQELKAELQTLAELSGNLMKAMEQRQFFFEGYANGSASISECNEAASNESKAYSNLWNFLKNEGL